MFSRKTEIAIRSPPIVIKTARQRESATRSSEGQSEKDSEPEKASIKDVDTYFDNVYVSDYFFTYKAASKVNYISPHFVTAIDC